MMSSNLTWNPLVANYSWWEMGFNDGSFGGQSFKTGLTNLAFIDTGAPFINMPIFDYKNLVDLLEAAI
jgi:hypothetical protein